MGKTFRSLHQLIIQVSDPVSLGKINTQWSQLALEIRNTNITTKT